MIVVFWLEENLPKMQSFNSNEMSKALTSCEVLRAKRKDGAAISHVCIQSELEQVVGSAGVSSPSADYDWRKRREDPATFGRGE